MSDKSITYGIRDEVLQSIINLGKEHDLERILLFGSRARGDYRERSDIDIAVSGKNADVFSVDIEQNVPTLLKFDVVNMDKPVQKELLDSIGREGILIYEKV